MSSTALLQSVLEDASSHTPFSVVLVSVKVTAAHGAKRFAHVLVSTTRHVLREFSLDHLHGLLALAETRLVTVLGLCARRCVVVQPGVTFSALVAPC